MDNTNSEENIDNKELKTDQKLKDSNVCVAILLDLIHVLFIPISI